MALLILLPGCRSAPTTRANDATRGRPPQADIEGSYARRLGQEMDWLKKSFEQGHLSKEEYQRSRESALIYWVTGLAEYTSRPNMNYNAHWLHDELDQLANMKQTGVLTEREYERARSAMVNRYLGTNTAL